MESATGKRKNEESQELSKRPKTELVPVSGLVVDIGWDVIFKIFSYLLKIGSTFRPAEQLCPSDPALCKTSYPSIPLVCKMAYEWYKGKEDVRLDYLLQEERGTYQAYMACVWNFCVKGPFERFNRFGNFRHPFSPFDGKSGTLSFSRSEETGDLLLRLFDCQHLIPEERRKGFGGKEYLVFATPFLAGDDGNCGINSFVSEEKIPLGTEPFPDGHIFWSIAKRYSFSNYVFECKPLCVKFWLSTVREDANLNSQLRAIMKELNKVVGFF